MGWAERRKNAEIFHEELVKRKLERAHEAVNKVMATDQFKASLMSLPDAKIAIDDIVGKVVKGSIDPVNDFLDKMHARHYREAEIRRWVHSQYEQICLIDKVDPKPGILFEEMLPIVADYVFEHQELYNGLNRD